MPVYIIGDIEVKTPEAYQKYREQAPAIIERHGGTYCVRGGEAQVLEGDWQPARLVVLRFPDRASAEAFYNDPDYQPLKALRQSASAGSLLMVEGV